MNSRLSCAEATQVDGTCSYPRTYEYEWRLLLANFQPLPYPLFAFLSFRSSITNYLKPWDGHYMKSKAICNNYALQ